MWLSSNCLQSRLTGKKLENSAFDVGGGRPKAFGVALNRKLLGGFYYEGIEFEFNFSKFWMLPRTKFKFYEDDTYIYWKVWQENRNSLMKIDAKCKKSEMLFINYEAPDGQKRYEHLWNGGTGEARIRLYEKTLHGLYLVDDIDATHVGCEAGEYDR